MKRIILVSSLLMLLVTGIGCTRQESATNVGISEVALGGTVVKVTVATSPAEQRRGLGGVSALAWDQGMLFVFDAKQVLTFWMKDMLIPIDIIWLSDQTIVGIERNVPPPRPAATDADLPVYSSPEPANRVLEVAAGFADRYGLKPGDSVEYR